MAQVEWRVDVYAVRGSACNNCLIHRIKATDSPLEEQQARIKTRVFSEDETGSEIVPGEVYSLNCQ